MGFPTDSNRTLHRFLASRAYARLRPGPNPVPNPTVMARNVVAGPSSRAQTFTASASSDASASLAALHDRKGGQWI